MFVSTTPVPLIDVPLINWVRHAVRVVAPAPAPPALDQGHQNGE